MSPNSNGSVTCAFTEDSLFPTTFSSPTSRQHSPAPVTLLFQPVSSTSTYRTMYTPFAYILATLAIQTYALDIIPAGKALPKFIPAKSKKSLHNHLERAGGPGFTPVHPAFPGIPPIPAAGVKLARNVARDASNSTSVICPGTGYSLCSTQDLCCPTGELSFRLLAGSFWRWCSGVCAELTADPHSSQGDSAAVPAIVVMPDSSVATLETAVLPSAFRFCFCFWRRVAN